MPKRKRRGASQPDWLGSHGRALEFYGAAPTIIVPDNPKVGVTRADRYEPELQRSYEEMAAHYRCVVIPPRPYRPKDKSRVELTVLLVCRWILARRGSFCPSKRIASDQASAVCPSKYGHS